MIKSKIILLVLLSLLSTCVSDQGEVYNEIYTFDKGLQKDSIIQYDFEIKDTTKSYDIALLLRHDVDYSYYNLYLQCELRSDSLSHYKKTREFFLFEPKTGNPEGFGTFYHGKSLGGIYDHQYPLFKAMKFTEAGKYSFRFKNHMRDDKSANIHAMGVSIRILD